MALVIVAVACAACNNGPTVCSANEVALPRAVPADTTIDAGASYTLRLVQGSPCTGVQTDLAAHWSTSDTTVVGLDTLTGRVTGLHTGEAHAMPTYDSFATATVHVR